MMRVDDLGAQVPDRVGDGPDDVEQGHAVEPLVREIDEAHLVDAQRSARGARRRLLRLGHGVMRRDAVRQDQHGHPIAPVDMPGDGPPHPEDFIIRVGSDDEDRRRGAGAPAG